MPEFWNVRQLSRAMDLDERLVGRAVADLVPTTINGRKCYDVGDAVEACWLRKHGLDLSDDPAMMAPWDRLHHYKAERERLAVDRDSSRLLNAAECREIGAAALEVVTPILERLATELEVVVGADGAPYVRRHLANLTDRLHEGLAFDAPPPP